jgi:hypothetical protein
VAAFNLVAVSIAARLEGNAAGGDGGGIALLDESTLRMEDGAALRGNRAEGSGGCLYSGGARTELCESHSDFVPPLLLSSTEYRVHSRNYHF